MHTGAEVQKVWVIAERESLVIPVRATRPRGVKRRRSSRMRVSRGVERALSCFCHELESPQVHESVTESATFHFVPRGIKNDE